MAKYLTVFSDSHGCRRNLQSLVGDFYISDKIVFLGDGAGDLIELFEFQDKLIKVKGNCDFSFSIPKEEIFCLEGAKFLAVHGDLYGVKINRDRLFEYAKARDVNCVLYGHTHKPLIEEKDGVIMVNPGTLSGYGSNETFAFITVKNGLVTAKIIPLSKRV